MGARFKARNKMPNRPAFSNEPVVLTVDPGREFAFARTDLRQGMEQTLERMRAVVERDGAHRQPLG